jgi:hypothetical protein
MWASADDRRSLITVSEGRPFDDDWCFLRACLLTFRASEPALLRSSLHFLRTLLVFARPVVAGWVEGRVLAARAGGPVL